MACFQPPTCVPRTTEARGEQSLPFGEGWIFIVSTALVMYVRLLWETQLKAVMMEKIINILDELLLA